VTGDGALFGRSFGFLKSRKSLSIPLCQRGKKASPLSKA